MASSLATSTSSIDPSIDRPHLDVLNKGFDICAVAGTFMAAVQAQILSTTIATSKDTTSIRVINALFLAGLMLDIMASTLSFLTSRWLQRLSKEEKDLLENCLKDKNAAATASETKLASHKEAFYRWLSISLFIPMPLLVFGVLCMLVGIYAYVWTQQPILVASIATAAGAIALPFLTGVFIIGRGEARRKAIIKRLATMQGDW